MILYDVLNEVTAQATQGPFEDEVRKAREAYFARTGPVNEDGSSFETRMSLFLEWYIFDRPLTQRSLTGGLNPTAENGAVTPIDYFINQPLPKWQGEELKILQEVKNNRHSIFEFSRIKDNGVSLVDLSDQKKLEVIERRGTSGLLKASVLEARVLPYNDKYYFSGPMLFHPPGAKKFIRKLFKKKEKTHDDILFMLSAMALKCEHYRHVPFEKIYSDGEGNLKL